MRLRLWRSGGIGTDAIEHGPYGDDRRRDTLSVQGDQWADPDVLLGPLDQRVWAETWAAGLVRRPD